MLSVRSSLVRRKLLSQLVAFLLLRRAPSLMLLQLSRHVSELMRFRHQLSLRSCQFCMLSIRSGLLRRKLLSQLVLRITTQRGCVTILS
jgi:hypothetical protein